MDMSVEVSIYLDLSEHVRICQERSGYVRILYLAGEASYLSGYLGMMSVIIMKCPYLAYGFSICNQICTQVKRLAISLNQESGVRRCHEMSGDVQN